MQKPGPEMSWDRATSRRVCCALDLVEAVLVEADGGAGELAVALVAVDGIAEARDRVGRRAGRLGRLDLDVAVTGNARTSRDQLTDDHVLLQADELVGALVDRGIGKHCLLYTSDAADE